jgi:hypothetical protein
MAKIGINDEKFFILSPLRPSAFGQLAGGAFLRLDSLRAKLSKRKKAPPANCLRAEGRRGEGMKINKIFRIFL